jgi:lysyl-tRNA synthetase class I
MVKIYSRYDIATSRTPKKTWFPYLMVCEKCAKKYKVLESYNNSNLRSIPYEEEPGCELCGEKAYLSETFFPYEIYKKIPCFRENKK